MKNKKQIKYIFNKSQYAIYTDIDKSNDYLLKEFKQSFLKKGYLIHSSRILDVKMVIGTLAKVNIPLKKRIEIQKKLDNKKFNINKDMPNNLLK